MTDDSPTIEERLLDAEQDVRKRLAGHDLDLLSLGAISNIYRAAAEVRRRAENGVLRKHSLTFGGFTILWVLWIWGDMGTARLSNECGLTKGTLTGMLATLEKRRLVLRTENAEDRRRVDVVLTAAGADLISDLYREFNAFEAEMSSGLSNRQKRDLAAALRTVIANASLPAD